MSSGKPEASAAPGLGPQTPSQKNACLHREACGVEDLPDELAVHVMKYTDVRDLCALSSVSARFARLGASQACQLHWRGLFCQRYGPGNAVHAEAAKLAGSWSRLFAARCLAEKEAFPWQKPSHYEVEAAVRRMVAGPEPSEVDGTVVLFLVDGSGSVTEADFACMQDFMRTAVGILAAPGAAEGEEADLGAAAAAAAAAAAPPLLFSIIQFSTEVRVELAPTALGVEAFGEAVGQMARMNGGTDIAAALRRAGQLLKPLGPRCRRVLALLTDARVDEFAAREAGEMAARLADEQAGVRLRAFGVGRGVAAADMLRVIGAEGAGAGGDAEGRYLALHVDEAPW